MNSVIQIVCVAAVVVLAACAVQIHAQPALYSSDFEDTNDLLSEWSNSSTDITPGTGPHPTDRFLGQFINDTVTLTLNDLPAHNNIAVSFDLYVIRTWDSGDNALRHASLLELCRTVEIGEGRAPMPRIP
jgi:hypothetical protein